MSPVLWLFAVVMEVIVLGIFGGGMFLMYRVGKRQSAATTAPGLAGGADASAQGGVLALPNEREVRTSATA